MNGALADPLTTLNIPLGAPARTASANAVNGV